MQRNVGYLRDAELRLFCISSVFILPVPTSFPGPP